MIPTHRHIDQHRSRTLVKQRDGEILCGRDGVGGGDVELVGERDGELHAFRAPAVGAVGEDVGVDVQQLLLHAKVWLEWWLSVDR